MTTPNGTPLQTVTRNAIETLLQSQNESHTALDVLRTMREEASLLYERQQILDALDADPMKQFGDCRAECERIKVRTEQHDTTKTR